MVTSQVDDQTLRLPESVSIILGHVLRDLLFNAIYHAKTGEARIAITQDSTDPPSLRLSPLLKKSRLWRAGFFLQHGR
jgi:hypothetical protein